MSVVAQPDEPTRKMRRSELRSLVHVVRRRSNRPTAPMPRAELSTLLRVSRSDALATPDGIVVDTTERVAPLPSPIETTERVRAGVPAERPRLQLAAAFVGAVAAGVLLTMPLWW